MLWRSCIGPPSQPKLALSLPIKGPSFCRLTVIGGMDSLRSPPPSTTSRSPRMRRWASLWGESQLSRFRSQSKVQRGKVSPTVMSMKSALRDLPLCHPSRIAEKQSPPSGERRMRIAAEPPVQFSGPTGPSDSLPSSNLNSQIYLLLLNFLPHMGRDDFFSGVFPEDLRAFGSMLVSF